MSYELAKKYGDIIAGEGYNIRISKQYSSGLGWSGLYTIYVYGNDGKHIKSKCKLYNEGDCKYFIAENQVMSSNKVSI